MMTHRSVCLALSFLTLASVGCRAISPVRLEEKAPVPTQPLTFAPGEQRVTDHVVIITDASGTQYVNETFPSAKALTQSFVTAMPDASAPAVRPGNYTAGSIGFGGNDRHNAPQAAFNRSALASQAQTLEVMGSIDGMGGTTPLHAVIGEASQSLEGKSGQAALVIFSDGLPQDQAATLAAAQGLIDTYKGGEVCIHAVQTGTAEEGYAFLKQLTSLTNCGSLRNEADLTTGAEVQQLARAVFVGGGAAVAAVGPCDGVTRLRGINFEFDKAVITEDSKPVLDVAAERLTQCPEIRVTIGGHTDGIGSDEYNMDLSYRRAEATKAYFVSQGVPAARLDTEGFGKRDPIAPNDTADGRAQNRRVELAPGN